MNDPNEARTAATMRDFRAALRESATRHAPAPPDWTSLLDSARDDGECTALLALGTKRRKALNRVLHHLAAGADDAEAKRLAAADCGTSVHAIDETFSHLKRVHDGDS